MKKCFTAPNGDPIVEQVWLCGRAALGFAATVAATCFFSVAPTHADEQDRHRSRTFMDEGQASLRWEGFKLPDGSPLAPYVSTPMFQGVSTGDEDAPITLVLIDNDPHYELPYYTNFYRQILPELEKQYVSTGISRIVALPLHAGGTYGIALWCADDQDAGWQFNKTAYSEFAPAFYSLASIAGESDIHVLAPIAEHAGLDVARFLKCLRARRTLLPFRDVAGNNRMASISNRMVEHPARIEPISISVGETHPDHLIGTSLMLPRNTADAMLDWTDLQIRRLLHTVDRIQKR